MEFIALLAFVIQGLRITVPYALAALGGVLSERSGVINLGLEGMLLAGAFAAAAGSHLGGVPAGVVAGALGGLAVAALYAVAVLRARADQVVAGVAINLLVIGLTRYLLKLVFHSASNSPAVPGLGGPGAAGFVAATALAVLGAHVWLARTPSGLRLRAEALAVTQVDLGKGALAVRFDERTPIAPATLVHARCCTPAPRCCPASTTSPRSRRRRPITSASSAGAGRCVGCWPTSAGRSSRGSTASSTQAACPPRERRS